MRKEIGPIASPDLIQFAPGLPKTRSGKIMRRILRKIAEDEFGNLGDTSTLADPAVVDDLVNNRQNKKARREGVLGFAARSGDCPPRRLQQTRWPVCAKTDQSDLCYKPLSHLEKLWLMNVRCGNA